MNYIIGIAITLVSAVVIYGVYDMLKQINKIEDSEK